MSTVFTDKQIVEYLKEINDDDLRTMFGSSIISCIKNKPQEFVEDKLFEYFAYDMPVKLGDIIEFKDTKYVVTCVYTDNSVDLLNENANKINKGLYNVQITKVGELQCIVE